MADTYRSAAIEIFSRTKYEPEEVDIRALAENIQLLEETGLADLNGRLMSARTKIFDTIAEHNVGAMLVRGVGKISKLGYELKDYGPRPIDFTVGEKSPIVRMQMKRFGELARDNKRNNWIEEIKNKAAAIEVPRFFGVQLSETFADQNLQGFLNFLADLAAESETGKRYEYLVGESACASVEFWDARSTRLESLTLGTGGDSAAVNITGLAAGQIRERVRTAADAFVRDVDGDNINLVIAEVDKHFDIDVAEACFGTEEELFGPNGRHAWHRLPDGVFADAAISRRLAGLVALRRNNSDRPVSDYDGHLYVNHPHAEFEGAICKVLPVRGVIRYNMRPDNSGNFK